MSSLLLKNSNIFNDTVVVRKKQMEPLLFEMKKCYHLTEAEAVIRLREHYRKINSGDKDVITKRVIKDADDENIMIGNINYYIEQYPEMAI